MSAIQDYLALVARHGPFLLMLLPVVGAILVVVSAPFGTDVLRRTALTNVFLSVAIAVLMLVHFRGTPPGKPVSGLRLQMAGEATLEPGASHENEDRASKSESGALLRLVVGVDGVGLWFIVIVPVLMFPAVREASAMTQPAGYLVLLLLSEACWVGVFAATDALFFIICLEASGLLLFAMIGRFGGPDHRRELASLAISQFVAELLILFGLIVLVMAHGQFAGNDSVENGSLSFLLQRITAALPPNVPDGSPGDSFWQLAEPLIFWSLTVGLIARSALFPFHGRFCDNSGPWPIGVGITTYGLIPALATFGYVRWVLPVCPTSADAATAILVPVSLCGAIVCALLSLKQTELKRVVAYSSVAHAGIAFAATATLIPEGLAGGVMHGVGHALSFTLLTIAVVKRELPRWSAAMVFLAAVTICGLPLLSGFPTQWLTLVGLRGMSEFTGIVAVVMATVATLLLAWSLIRAAVREWIRESETSDEAERGIACGVVLPITLLLAVGLAPQFVLDRLIPALQEISPQSFLKDAAESEDGR